MDAHLLLTRLESEGLECWLQDENTVTIYPVWTNAVGGIKLLVKKEDVPRAGKFSGKLKTTVNRRLSVLSVGDITLNW